MFTYCCWIVTEWGAKWMSLEKFVNVEHFPSIPREPYLSPRSFSSRVFAERSNLGEIECVAD